MPPPPFTRPKLSGVVTIHRFQPPQLVTTARISKGELTEDLPTIAARLQLAVSDGSELCLIDAHGISILSRLVDGGTYYVGGGVVLEEDALPPPTASTGDQPPWPSSSQEMLLAPDISVAWAYDERVLLHEPGTHRSPETPYRLQRAMEMLRQCPRSADLLPAELLREPSVLRPALVGRTGGVAPVCLLPRFATAEEILSVHDRGVYGNFLNSGEALQDLRSDVYCNEQTSAVAVKLSVAAVIDASRAVLDGVGRYRCTKQISADPLAAFCLVRPPGHHCTARRPSGFCLVNNVAIAAYQVLTHSVLAGRQPRVAILDLDVHYGEGTVEFVNSYQAPAATRAAASEADHFPLLYLSLHRFDEGRFYPFEASGASSCTGGRDRGGICNVGVDTSAHVPGACERVISDFLLERVMREVFLPRLAAFRPDLVLLSLGFDAAYGDPLGKMAVEGGFAQSVRVLKHWCLHGHIAVGTEEMASPSTPLPGHIPAGLVVVLEGGYNPEAVAVGVLGVAHALSLPPHDASVAAFARARVPKVWGDLRRRQNRKVKEWQETGKEGNPPLTVPDDTALLERHLQWCSAVIEDVRRAHQ